VRIRGTAKKKSVGSGAGQRPVLQFRVHEDVYNDIKKSAERLKLTISEEAARRLDRYSEYEQAYGGAKKLMDDVEAVMAKSLEAAMSQAGYQRLPIDQGVVWAEPGVDWRRLSLSATTASMADEIWNHLQPKIEAALRGTGESK
jgi:hypothetical protein